MNLKNIYKLFAFERLSDKELEKERTTMWRFKGIKPISLEVFSTFRTKKKKKKRLSKQYFLAGAAVLCHAMAWRTVWEGREWHGRTGYRTRAPISLKLEWARQKPKCPHLPWGQAPASAPHS